MKQRWHLLPRGAPSAHALKKSHAAGSTVQLERLHILSKLSSPILHILLLETPSAANRARAREESAAGCLHGIKAVYQRSQHLHAAATNNAGGSAASANDALISSGRTQQAQSLHATFDLAEAWYKQLPEISLAAAHVPTQLDLQGSDRGSQSRLAIWHASRAQ